MSRTIERRRAYGILTQPLFVEYNASKRLIGAKNVFHFHKQYLTVESFGPKYPTRLQTSFYAPHEAPAPISVQ
jgi:hypothetical protein